MCAPNRRLERREDILAALRADFSVTAVVDLTKHETETPPRFLEGTGSMVFDHAHRVVYACVSPRTDRTLFLDTAARLGYDAVAFRAADADGVDIYHTNGKQWGAALLVRQRAGIAPPVAHVLPLPFVMVVCFPFLSSTVMMCIGTGVAVVCLESIVDDGERVTVSSRLVAGGLAVVDISRAQMAAFAGNMLCLRDGRDGTAAARCLPC